MKAHFPLKNFFRQNLTQSQCQENLVFEEEPKTRTRAFLRNSTGSQQFSKKTENITNKINFKYQRVNNTFKLVEVNSAEENKENCVNGKQQNAHKFLLMIHSLCERVERLERSKKFAEDKQNFEIHKLIDYVANEKLSRIQQKNSFYEKKMEEKLKQIQKVKNQIQDNFGNRFSQFLSFDKNVLQIKQLRQQMKDEINVLMHEKFCSISQNLEDFKNKIKIQNLQHKVGAPTKKVDENRKSGTPFIQFEYRQNVIFNSNTNWNFKSLYKVDQSGYLMDCENFYLVDRRGNLIRINEENLQKMKQMKIYKESS